jgi:hypothetical protein
MLLQPSSASRIIAADHDASDLKSHMFCGEWADRATIVPADDATISFTSVEAVQAAAASEKVRFGTEVCAAWKRLSESNLWISSWTDFPKFAKDICYAIMSICDRNLP